MKALVKLTLLGTVTLQSAFAANPGVIRRFISGIQKSAGLKTEQALLKKASDHLGTSTTSRFTKTEMTVFKQLGLSTDDVKKMNFADDIITSKERALYDYLKRSSLQRIFGTKATTDALWKAAHIEQKVLPRFGSFHTPIRPQGYLVRRGGGLGLGITTDYSVHAVRTGGKDVMKEVGKTWSAVARNTGKPQYGHNGRRVVEAFAAQEERTGLTAIGKGCKDVDPQTLSRFASVAEDFSDAARRQGSKTYDDLAKHWDAADMRLNNKTKWEAGRSRCNLARSKANGGCGFLNPGMAVGCGL